MFLHEDGKLTVRVPVTYLSFGEVELTFDSIKEMKEQLRDKEFISEMELPETDIYVEDSYEVDIEEVEYQLSLLQKKIDSDDSN